MGDWETAQYVAAIILALAAAFTSSMSHPTEGLDKTALSVFVQVSDVSRYTVMDWHGPY